MSATVENTREPASADELVKFISMSVLDHYQKTGASVDGSLLAFWVRREFPALSYPKLGLTKLGDAVRIATARNLISRNPNVKHLEVSPIIANVTPPTEAAVAPPTRDAAYVRQDIWRAMVFVSQSAISFFSRSAKNLREIDRTDANTLRSLRADPQYVEVERVESSAQLQWLKEFLDSRGKLDENTENSLLDLIRGGLHKMGAAIARDWKAERSRHVVGHVRKWAAAHQIAEADVLTPASRDAKKTNSPDQLTDGHITKTEDAIRRALLATLEEMSLSELENIAIPIRHILRHFTVK